MGKIRDSGFRLCLHLLGRSAPINMVWFYTHGLLLSRAVQSLKLVHDTYLQLKCCWPFSVHADGHLVNLTVVNWYIYM